LGIDPIDAEDVALFTSTCVQGCTSDPKTHLYRSQDGGHSWRELMLPQLPAGAGAAAPSFTSTLGWSGRILITETEAFGSDGHPIHHLLASAPAAGPLRPVDQGTVFVHTAVASLFTLGSAAYAELFPAGCTGIYFCEVAKTTDGGATWQALSLRYQSQSVDLLGMGGTSLIVGTPSGVIEHMQVARTTNDGQSWQRLPATPAGLTYYAVPDGTLFMTTLDMGAIDRLTMGAQHWQQMITSPTALPTSLDDGSLVFQCDAAGHPIAVWRDAGQDQSNNSVQYPGLQFHTI
jgi:hypothetical protein